MSSAHADGGEAGKKRKHEDDSVRAAKRRKRAVRRAKARGADVQNGISNHEVAREEPGNALAVLPTAAALKKSAKKLAKRERKIAELEASLTEKDPEIWDGVPTSRVPETKTERKVHKSRKSRRADQRESQKGGGAIVTATPDQPNRAVQTVRGHPLNRKGSISAPSAGRLLDHDPIFVRDAGVQEFLITANERETLLLSLETSLVVRTFSAPEGCSVLALTEDRLSDGVVHIAYSDGSIASWDWTRDGPSDHWFATVDAPIAIAGAPLLGEKSFPVLYITTNQSRYYVYVGTQRLSSTRKRLQSIQTLGNAQYIVVSGPSVLAIGKRQDGTKTEFEYTWVEIPLQTASTCLDARLLPKQTGKNNNPSRSLGLSLAIGCKNGQIHHFEDVSTLFKQREQASLPEPVVLHWHRNAVSSVKFSSDGNYIISGGHETVLVIWQLATGKRQYLPHLTSRLDKIVVNGHGDRYAVQMGDNSIMVLSTSELRPVAYFAGLQLSAQIKGFGGESKPAQAAVLHPKNLHQLLLTVPSSNPKSPQDLVNCHRPFLQTFDIRESRHVAQQMLADADITDFNTAPDGTPVEPSDVAHLAISRDGKWLATVDEWMSAPGQFSYAHESNVAEHQAWYRDLHLRFWRWDQDISQWTLSTRIDKPHRRSVDGPGAGRILSLVANPASSNTFATFGEDGCVKIWKARNSGWKCQNTLELQGRAATISFTKTCIAWHEDGSMMAVSSRLIGEKTVHYIDTRTWTIKDITPNVFEDRVTALVFLHCYIIVATSRMLYVRDLVTNKLVYTIKLPHLSADEAQSEPMLAADEESRTFGLVTHNKHNNARVAVYRPKTPDCLFKQDFETTPIEAILVGKGARCYTLLFADATIRTVTPDAVLRSHPPIGSTDVVVSEEASIQAGPDGEPEAELSDLEVGDTEQEHYRPLVLEEDDDDRPVVTEEQLAEAVGADQPSHALPSVQDMFKRVIALYAKKPYR